MSLEGRDDKVIDIVYAGCLSLSFKFSLIIVDIQ